MASNTCGLARSSGLEILSPDIFYIFIQMSHIRNLISFSFVKGLIVKV